MSSQSVISQTDVGTIVRVDTPELEKAFYRLPEIIYTNDPNWIRPLINDVKKVFDPRQNPFFEHGELDRWILKDTQGKVIGRVAAFIDEKKAHTFRQPTGGMGFFECVNNQDAAFLLFDTAKAWLAARGMEAMDGPVNFGERSQFWGLMVENDMDTPYQHCYNPLYYKDFFEAYGFQLYFEQLFFRYHMTQGMPKQYYLFAERFERSGRYRVEHFRLAEKAKYMQDFLTVYNNAWRTHDNFKELSLEQVESIFDSIKPIVDEAAIWFAYIDDQPASFFFMIPEINQIFKHINTGKMRLIDKLKFAWHKYTGKCRRLVILAFGVSAEYQKKGVEAVMMANIEKYLKANRKYESVVVAWIGDFNPKMVNMLGKFNTEISRRAVTYRKLFDPNAPFERSPILD